MRKLFILWGGVACLSLSAQVGINTDDPKGTLHVKTDTKDVIVTETGSLGIGIEATDITQDLDVKGNARVRTLPDGNAVADYPNIVVAKDDGTLGVAPRLDEIFSEENAWWTYPSYTSKRSLPNPKMTVPIYLRMTEGSCTTVFGNPHTNYPHTIVVYYTGDGVFEKVNAFTVPSSETGNITSVMQKENDGSGYGLIITSNSPCFTNMHKFVFSVVDNKIKIARVKMPGMQGYLRYTINFRL